MADKTTDHRLAWTGGPEIPTKLSKERVTQLVEEGPALLKVYQAMHGDWREVVSHTNTEQAYNATHSWEFIPCECATCQEAAELVGHPATPNG